MRSDRLLVVRVTRRQLRIMQAILIGPSYDQIALDGIVEGWNASGSELGLGRHLEPISMLEAQELVDKLYDIEGD